MLKKFFLIALLIPAFAYSSTPQDLSFIEGNWRCVTESDIGKGTTLKMESVGTTSLQTLQSFSKVTYTMYKNQNPAKTSVIYIETSDNFIIEDGLVKSYNYKKHSSKLIKDDLNMFTPKTVEWFAKGSGDKEFVSRVKQIDDNNFIAIPVPDDGTTIPCSKVK
ncbi:hypothetical protein J8M20_04215 [Pseudoalteromonas luteoviolacea]|uniref:hypothetical protein n=1 Tax=Pseudoalteromonas luteoviolacea TaxID=43657 RepID=UPI001B39A10D|nr:hypothetical protein [Pseudoalteromonas luteoviolacea]MBQ4810523.1 hypothetical protein [Pseudoalteromonas luteoviolacea]